MSQTSTVFEERLRAGVNPENHPMLPPVCGDIEPGEYQCGACYLRITVGPSGREYGHRPYGYYQRGDPPCPRRPTELLTEMGLEALDEEENDDD